MMILRLSLVVALAIISCHGLPTTDQVVPEGTGAGTVAEHHAKFNMLTPTDFIAAMTKSGVNGVADCRTFAESSKTDITDTVSSLQSTLNAVDTGAGCANEGQAAVTAATTALSNANAAVVTAQAAVVTAQAAQTTACTAVVTLRALPLDALEAELAAGCAAAEAFITGVSSTGYTTVKAACTQATTALTTAQATVVTNQATVVTAQATLDSAVKTAAFLEQACLCRVKSEQAAAWKAAGTASAEHAVAWKKSHEVICALDQTTTCTVPTCPAVTQPEVAAGVADAVCGIQITGMSSFSGTDCMVRDMTIAQHTSGSGDDGGVVFMGGPAGSPDAGHIMYEGDLNLVGFPGDLSRQFDRSTPTGSGMGSIFSELKANKVYRITSRGGGGLKGAPVYSASFSTGTPAVAYLQCLANGASSTSGLTEVALPAGLQMSSEKYNIFAGYGTAAFKDNNNHWQLIELNDCESTPTVTDLGIDTGSNLGNMYTCERHRQNGILERGAEGYSVLYACGGGNFCRKSLPSGNSATAFSFGSTYHSDTCSITMDLSTSRYFWHSEGTNSLTEPIYECPLSFTGSVESAATSQQLPRNAAV